MGNDNDDAAYGSDTDMDEQTQYGGESQGDEDASEQTERRADDAETDDGSEESEEEGFGQDETDPE